MGGQGKREKEGRVTGPHLHELRGNCHEVDLVNVDHPCSTLYPCERDFNLQLANEACSNNQRGFPRMMPLASRHQLGYMLYRIAGNFRRRKFSQKVLKLTQMEVNGEVIQ